ncbi:MAG: alanine/glycine:cation symporter family protein [Oscillospiraceae bacterium]
MIDKINSIVWGNWLLILMLSCGIYLSFKIGFIQFNLKEIFKGTILSKSSNQSGKDTISPFQTMTTSLSATMGTGNIVGVASAIMIGGAGSIFWLWVSAILGMALIYVENYLGILYRRKLKDGSTIGGACAYLEYGLKCKPLAVIFSILCIIASFGIGNMTQSNSIATSLKSEWNIPVTLTGIVTSMLIALVIMGGVKRIGSITQLFIPILSLIYILGALTVIVLNAQRLPIVFKDIFLQAFGINQVTGGITGSLIITSLNVGLRRGVFSNEAGLGSSSILHSSSECDNPHTMGLWGMLEVFIDTIICCTLTALAILITNPNFSTLDSSTLVINSFKNGLGEFSGIFISLAISLFAFATLIGWSVCGEKCSKYLFGDIGGIVYKIFFVICIFLGAILNASSVWIISDIFNGLMAIPNLIGIMLLSNRVTKDIKR